MRAGLTPTETAMARSFTIEDGWYGGKLLKVTTYAKRADGVDIKTTVRLIENRERRTEHCKLKDLGSLLLASGKPFVQVTASELLVHTEFVHLVPDLFTKLAHRN